jgi:hypothetical protein
MIYQGSGSNQSCKSNDCNNCYDCQCDDNNCKKSDCLDCDTCYDTCCDNKNKKK